MSTEHTNSPLAELRAQIDELDEQILRAIAQRAAIARTIGKVKVQQGLDILQSDREQEKYSQVTHIATTLGINTSVAVGVFKLLLADSRQVQQQSRT